MGGQQAADWDTYLESAGRTTRGRFQPSLPEPTHSTPHRHTWPDPHPPRPYVSKALPDTDVEDGSELGNKLLKDLSDTLRALARELGEWSDAERRTTDLVHDVHASPATAVGLGVAPGAVQEALRRLADMAALPKDWDSYGAERSSSVAVGETAVLVEAVAEAALGTLGARIAPWTSAPIADGGIQVEWVALERRIEVQVGPDGSLGYLIEREPGNQSEYEEEEEASFQDVVNVVIGVLTP